jgi:hypothetical protein
MDSAVEAATRLAEVEGTAEAAVAKPSAAVAVVAAIAAAVDVEADEA